MARSRMLLGVGFPLVFVSITSASYDGIPPDKTGQASALINAARNTGFIGKVRKPVGTARTKPAPATVKHAG
jgi:hypothetical protein